MKKLSEVIIALLLGIVMLFGVAGCNGIAANKYTVSFDSSGGSEVKEITDIKSGKKIDKPTDPVLEGCVFMGWYKSNAENAVLWDWDIDVITEDITLYAKWRDKSLAKGTFYSLEKAYEKGLLIRDDIMHISYFLYGTVVELLDDSVKSWYGEYKEPEKEWVNLSRVKFVPKIDPPILNAEDEIFIKAAYINWKESMGEDHIFESEDIGIIKYLGSYNGDYVVQIIDGNGHDGIIPISIAGIVFMVDEPIMVYIYE